MPPRKTDKWEAQHQRNLLAYERQIDAIYKAAVAESAAIAGLCDFSPVEPFSFSKYPITQERVKKLLCGLGNDLYAAIVNGVRSEWTLANRKNDELCNVVFGDMASLLTDEQRKRYYATNPKAQEAFLARKESGLNLSDRVWKYTDQFKEEIEMGIDIGLRDGLSADELSRDLRQYLQYPDKLFRRVRDEHGILQLSKAAKAFHPGQGVYRSSYKNARRLAATEANIAYRTADYERWQQLDFVVGFEVKLSNNHPVTDICDYLKGRYPKDFKYTGWHPHCRCYVVSILKTPEEMQADNERILQGGEPSEGSVNTVTDVPQGLRDWLKDNEKRAMTYSSLPYFIKDNKGMFDGYFLEEAIKETMANASSSGNYIQDIAEKISQRFNANCTPINFKGKDSIRRKVYSERDGNPIFKPDDLKDAVRTTIIASETDIPSIISALKDLEGFIRHKPQNTPLGYTGNIVNIKSDSGLIAEIQVNTAKMIYAKEKPADARRVIGDDLWEKIHMDTGLEGGLGHKYYESYRILDPESVEAQNILKQSLEYYKHFNS